MDVLLEQPPVSTPRLAAKKFFLTYSQVGDDADFHSVSLANFLFEFPYVDYVRVNRELHQDGGIHYHAVITFTRRYQGVVATCFNFRERHPNIRTLRTRRYEFNCLEYVVKYGDAFLVDRGTIPSADDLTPAKRNPWGDALESSSTVAEFMQAIEHDDPKSFCLRYFDLLAFANHRFNAPSTYIPEFPRDSFTVPEAADQWVTDVLGEVYLALRHRSTLFIY